ncbi:hypothetical protein DV738_g626, partial [Chaetothyriales sp. CBS 135597]
MWGLGGASATTTHPQSSSSLPPEVAQCLRNARFLHLATISSKQAGQPTPQVSLMNYTFLPDYRDQGPVIIMTTNARSLKTENLVHNPNVSILVHDWVSHRPPTASAVSGQRSGSPPAAAQSSLAALLLNLNTSALSSISTTIAGTARFVEAGSEEEKWCKEAHLANNTFGDQETSIFHPASAVPESNTDWKGGVKDWVLDRSSAPTQDGQQLNSGPRGRAAGTDHELVNGIIN